MGLTYLNLSENKEAIKSFNRAVAIQPSHTLSLNSLAEVLYLTGKTNEAIEIFEKIIKIKPDFDKAYLNLANIHSSNGNLIECINVYKNMLKTKPDSPEVLNQLGVKFLEMNKPEEALFT